MSDVVTEIGIAFPDRASSSFSSTYPKVKPRAEITFRLEGGGERKAWAPVRVARAFQADQPVLPASLASLKETLGALEGSICFTVLTEMLSRRDYGTAEAEGRLLGYGFHADAVARAVARATELRFLDDGRFAVHFIEERKRRGWGQRKVEQELKRRGLNPGDIEGYPEAFFSADDDLERARDILARRRVPEARAFEKLVRHLMSKGFSYAVAADAVRERLAGDAG